MKRSPLNTPRGFRGGGSRHAPYNWKSYENANSRGYHSAGTENCQRFSLNNDMQPRGNDFIPLDVSTPTQREKHGINWHNSASGRNNLTSRGWYNYRGNYHGNPRLNSSNRYPAYNKHPGKKFHGQNKTGHKTAHRQQNISMYVNVQSMLEDPWADLVKKLNDSKDKSENEIPKNESDIKLIDCESIEESESTLSRNTNLDNSQCNQDSKNMSIIDISFEDTDLHQTSKINSSMDSKTDDTDFSQDSINGSTSTINDKISENVQEENVHSNALVMDTNQKSIDQ